MEGKHPSPELRALGDQPAARAPARRRLLIVDDEPVILEMLVSMFEHDAYEVTAADTGAAAWAAIDAGIDVLLTDKNLPDISGIELLAHAKQVAPDTEVIVITGYASIETAVQAMQLGAFDYIVKPPKSIFEVKRKVEQAFSRQAIVRENAALVQDLRHQNDALERAMLELRETQEELIQSEKLAGIGTLAAGVAHEIASPLFGILGLAEAIGEESRVDTIHEYAAEIVEYSRSIREIVQALSGYSRTSESQGTPVDLERVIEDAARLVLRSTQSAESFVRLELESGLRIQARANELQQVFVNLIKNAVEALSEHGGSHVLVRARREGAHVVAEVIDDGPGIPEAHLKSIFDPFFTTKPPGKGTGLGLNIVYRIISRHHGSIQVESAVGLGTRFTIRLPEDAQPDHGTSEPAGP